MFPHDHPHLFAMLAGQILRGRKVIILPEGGVVKNHLVIDKRGEYSIYSRNTGDLKRSRKGIAVALGVNNDHELSPVTTTWKFSPCHTLRSSQ